jgi:hypothetical protein
MNYLDLSPEYIARVTAILTRPMTALEFADLFWPERVKRKPGIRSIGGHALLNALVRNGLVKRVKSKQGPDTFRVPSKKSAVSILPSKKAVEAIQAQLRPSTFYWVLLLHEGERWAWLGPNDRAWELTQHPAKRSRYETLAEAMVMLWTFRQHNPERGKNIRLVRVRVHT